MGLGGIFNQPNAAFMGEGNDRLHFNRLAIQMYDDNGPGPRRDGGCDRFDRYMEPPWRRLGGDRDRSHHSHAEPSGDEGMCGYDHLVARLDASGFERNRQRIKAVTNADRMGAISHRRERLLKGLNFAAKDKAARIQDPCDGCVQLGPHLGVGCPDIEKRHADGNLSGGAQSKIPSATAARNAAWSRI